MSSTRSEWSGAQAVPSDYAAPRTESPAPVWKDAGACTYPMQARNAWRAASVHSCIWLCDGRADFPNVAPCRPSLPLPPSVLNTLWSGSRYIRQRVSALRLTDRSPVGQRARPSLRRAALPFSRAWPSSWWPWDLAWASVVASPTCSASPSSQ